MAESRRPLAGYETMPSPALTDAQLNAIVSEHGLELDGPIVRMRSSGVVHSLWSLGSRWVLRVPKNEAMCLGDHRCEAVAIPLARMAGVRTPSLVVFDDSGSLLDVPFSVVTRVDGDDLVAATFDHHAYERVGRELARLHASDLADHDHPWLRTPDPTPAESLFESVLDAGLLHAAGVRWLDTLLGRLDAIIARSTPAPTVFVHGDVKPDNVMLDRDGNVHLIDWGDSGFGDPAHDFESLPMESIARALRGYRSVRDADRTLEARIVRRVTARALYNLTRSPLTGPSWHRPVAANLTDLLTFAIDHPRTRAAWTTGSP